MQSQLHQLQNDIAPIRQQLIDHPIYSKINTIEKLRVFMEHHVFAVWDFMSLLKTLQRELTCVDVPWLPVGDANTRYLINEIVTGEESDIDQSGVRMSHFELYLQAMQQTSADASRILQLTDLLRGGASLDTGLQNAGVNQATVAFVKDTFGVIAIKKAHIHAAVFTFGREDLIPGMFISFVRDINTQTKNTASVFQYYLERHIEVDGDHHSHLAYEMTEVLCGDDALKWKEATEAVILSLHSRLQFWDSIVVALDKL